MTKKELKRELIKIGFMPTDLEVSFFKIAKIDFQDFKKKVVGNYDNIWIKQAMDGLISWETAAQELEKLERIKESGQI